jgi:hypothetical protein
MKRVWILNNFVWILAIISCSWLEFNPNKTQIGSDYHGLPPFLLYCAQLTRPSGQVVLCWTRPVTREMSGVASRDNHAKQAV